MHGVGRKNYHGNFLPVCLQAQIITPVITKMSYDKEYYREWRTTRQLGLPSPKRTEINCDLVKELYLKGESTRYIASMLGVSQFTIRKILSKNGIVMRPRGGNHPRGKNAH